MTRTAADFVLFTDKTEELYFHHGIKEEVTKSFEANILELSIASGQGAILSWNVRRIGSDENPIKYYIEVNGYDTSHGNPYLVRDANFSTRQEVIPTNVLRPGKNEVTVKILRSDSGAWKNENLNNRLMVSDIVVWYRQKTFPAVDL